MESLNLKGVKVLFTEYNNADFGSSITLDVTDDSVRTEVEKFYTENNINKGVAKIKEYTNTETGETTKQYTIKLAEFVEVLPEGAEKTGIIRGIDEVAKVARDIKLGRGATINIAIRPYEYNNTFGTGISASAVAIVIVKGADFKSAFDDLM